MHDLAQFTVGVFGKFFSSFTGILGCLFDHLRLDLVQAGVFVLYVVTVFSADNGNTVFKQFALFADKATHQIYLVGCYGDDTCHVIAVCRGRSASVPFRFHVDYFRCADTDFLFFQSFLFQKLYDGLIAFLDFIIERVQVVAQAFVD